MPGPDQEIKTVLIPEDGLDLSPEFIQQSIVTPDFSRVFAYLIGKAPKSGILIRATSDGSLKVVSAGTPFEEYLICSGVGNVDYIEGNIFELDVAYQVSDFLIETNPAIISFRNASYFWLLDKILPVGMHSINFIHYGVRIKNRNDPGDVDYEITVYR